MHTCAYNYIYMFRKLISQVAIADVANTPVAAADIASGTEGG